MRICVVLQAHVMDRNALCGDFRAPKFIICDFCNYRGHRSAECPSLVGKAEARLKMGVMLTLVQLACCHIVCIKLSYLSNTNYLKENVILCCYQTAPETPAKPIHSQVHTHTQHAISVHHMGLQNNTDSHNSVCLIRCYMLCVLKRFSWLRL